MPRPEKNREITDSANPTSPQNPISTEKLQMLMASLSGGQDLPVNEDHVTEMLSQRRQINEFINKDKGRDSKDRKYFLTAGLIFILLISALIIFTRPEYFTQVLSLIIGGFGGFGFGKGFSKG